MVSFIVTFSRKFLFIQGLQRISVYSMAPDKRGYWVVLMRDHNMFKGEIYEKSPNKKNNLLSEPMITECYPVWGISA